MSNSSPSRRFCGHNIRAKMAFSGLHNLCGDLKNQKLSFAGPLPRATCVVDPGYLCPICSLYNTQQKCQRQYVLILPAEKVIVVPKVVPTEIVIFRGVRMHMFPLGYECICSILYSRANAILASKCQYLATYLASKYAKYRKIESK